MSDSSVRNQQHRFTSNSFPLPSPCVFFPLYAPVGSRLRDSCDVVSISSISHVSLPRDQLRRAPIGSILFPCFMDSISVCYVTYTSLYHVQQSEYRSCSPPSTLFPSIPSARPSHHPPWSSLAQPWPNRLRVQRRYCWEAPGHSLLALSVGNIRIVQGG
jgi:hypothetical protein